MIYTLKSDYGNNDKIYIFCLWTHLRRLIKKIILSKPFYFVAYLSIVKNVA